MESSSLVGNRYWVLRHGKSIPNERGLIVSSTENGVLPEFQLATDGVAQARLAGELFLKQLEESKIAIDKVRICYSPFSRTTHTARIVSEVLNLPFHAPHCKVLLLFFSSFFFSETLLCPLKAVVLLSAMHRTGDGLAERSQMTRVASVLSQHRNFALLTGELRPLF